MMGWELARRAEPSRLMKFLSPVQAIALTLLVGLAIFAALGQDPMRAFWHFFIAPVSSANGLSELLLKASPLCLIGLGLAISYRANVWNIGAEGQMYIGGVFATGIAIHTVGVGTSDSGQLIPGTDEPADLDEPTLRAIASLGHGTYASARDAVSLSAAFRDVARVTVWERKRVDGSTLFAASGGVLVVLSFLAGFAAGKFP